MILKYLFFLFHICGIIITLFGLLFCWQILILQGIVILSWYFNNNKCLITQLEDYFFNESIIDFYFYLTNNNQTYNKYIVPKYQRYSLYFLFFGGILFYIKI